MYIYIYTLNITILPPPRIVSLLFDVVHSENLMAVEISLPLPPGEIPPVKLEEFLRIADAWTYWEDVGFRLFKSNAGLLLRSR